MSDNNATVLRLSNVSRSYHQGGMRLDVFDGANLTIHRGEQVALIGPSGAGKSSLLHIAGLLEKPDAGGVEIAGQACSGLSDDRRTWIRRVTIGFVYQFHHLLPEFSALENVIMPQLIAGQSRKAAADRADSLLGQLGLAGRVQHRPTELSGGEQQRVAIARALANEPKLLLADEPTGNLDPATAAHVQGALVDLVRGSGLAILLATHNEQLAKQMDRIVRLEAGKLRE